MVEFIPLTNEKSKAERIISQVLAEIAKKYPKQLSLFSGESIDVDSSQDLAGECDFFFVLQPPKPYIEAGDSLNVQLKCMEQNFLMK